MAIADPCFSLGKLSSSTAWESGTSAAPNTPCTRRKATISGSEVAMPHSIEATVKPATDHANSRLRPKRAARNPAGGVMIAAATM